MIIKEKKNLKIAISSLLLIVIITVIVNKKDLLQTYRDFNQKLITLSLGYSDPVNLPDPPILSESKLRNPLAIINSIPDIVRHKLNYDNSNIQVINIDIDFLHYQTLMSDRNNAINSGVLIDPHTVPAMIRYRGNKYKAKVRLKGNLSDHWSSRYQMSMRVDIKKGKTVHGFMNFLLHKPGSRQHPFDQTFQKTMRNLGNLSSNHDYVRVVVNGVDWGVMNIEEGLSKVFLEKLQKKDSAVFQFSNKKMRQKRILLGDKDFFGNLTRLDFYPWYLSADQRLNFKMYGVKNKINDRHYRKIYSYISNLRLKENHQALYDIDKYSKVIILSSIWNNAHTITDSNIRHYFNPYTLKLEPITTDQGKFLSLSSTGKSSDGEYFRSVRDGLVTFSQVLSSKEYKKNLYKNINEVSVAIDGVDSIFGDYQKYYPLDKKIDTSEIFSNRSKILSNVDKYLSNSTRIKHSELEPTKPTMHEAKNFDEHVIVRHYEDGTIKIFNLIPDTVSLSKLLYKGAIVDENITIPAYSQEKKYTPVVISSTYTGIQDGNFTVHTEYQGNKKKSINRTTLAIYEMHNPLKKTRTNLPFLKKIDSENWEIQSGDWKIKKPIVINGNLKVQKGTNLYFSESSYIVVKGSLLAGGTIEEPITLNSINKFWKGLYVLGGGKKSIISNTKIVNTSSLEDGLLKLSSGLTFYNADLKVNNLTIENSRAEDALNIVKSNFIIDNISLRKTVSDAIDFDFSSGTLANSFFSSVGGDALDFSGSSAIINNARIYNVVDKAVSVGESSSVQIINSNFDDIGVGVASKDGSVVKISQSIINNYKMHALMTYSKKSFFGASVLTAQDCNIQEGDFALRQKGTIMTIDGKDFKESKVNVQKMYESKIMRK